MLCIICTGEEREEKIKTKKWDEWGRKMSAVYGLSGLRIVGESEGIIHARLKLVPRPPD